MNPAINLPPDVQTLSDHARMQSAATRLETPCGDGAVVWHSWGQGEPAMLLHGGSGSWTHWIRNITALVSRSYQVLVPDLPGFGDSALMPDGRDADVMPRWLNGGLNELIGTAHCNIVGFSYGAMVGTLMAAAYPERVKSLVMVGAPALSQIPMPRVGLRAWEHLQGSERKEALRHNLCALMLARESSVSELSLQLHEANLARDRLRRRRLARTDIVVRTLAQVDCPISGIWGARDAVYQERFHTIEPGLSVAPDYRGLTLIENSGHWTQFEDAAQFNQVLQRVMSNHANE